MQEFYDTCLPGNALLHNEYDSVTMQLFDNSLNVKDCVLDFSKSVPLPKEPVDFMKPVIQTAAEMPRKPCLLENLVAMIKRNFNSPDLSGVVDIEKMASHVVDRFFDCYFTKEVERIKADLFSDRVLSNWLEKQEATTVGQLANFDFIDLPDVASYSHMIKAQPKQKLDTSIASEYPALQTIVYHSKKINGIFGPLFSELTRQLLDGIDGNRFLFYTRKTPEEIQNFFGSIDSREKMEVLELDISKYDKSQGEFHCAIEYEIWRRLGFEGFMAEVWKQGHRRTTLRDFQAGIKTTLWYQRKSGDVTTFIGNTVIVAACLATLLPMEKCYKAAFCGDDSVVYMPSGLDYSNVQTNANLMWNFEAKLFKKKYGYFCGRFIIHHDKGAIVYYDPVKLISKLGIKHLRDEDHLEEFRTSLFDVAANYNNCAYFTQLSEAVREVFPNAGDGSFCFNTIYKYLSDIRLFKSLYYGGSDSKAKGVGVLKPYKGRRTSSKVLNKA